MMRFPTPKRRTGLIFLRSALLAAVLWLIPAAGQVAHAANVLILQTDETHLGGTQGVEAANILGNLASEFQDTGATVTVQSTLAQPGAITAATFTNGGPYDLVIVATVYVKADDTNMAAIESAIINRLANGFLLFMDSCCGSNDDQLKAAVNLSTGLHLDLSGTTGAVTVPLNTASPLSAGFAPSLRGGWAKYFTQVPADNALYLAAGASPPAAGTVTQAYGVFFPPAQVAGGAGACLFGVVDSTGFWDGGGSHTNFYGDYNKGQLGPQFIQAVMAPGGACAVAGAVKKSFADPVVAPGGVTTLTITLENNTVMPATSVQLTDALPAPLVLAAAPKTDCPSGTVSGAEGATTLGLSGGTIPAGTATPAVVPGRCTFSAQVRWPDDAAGTQACTDTPSLTNTIQPGSQFSTDQGQVSTPATATIVCNAALPPVGSMSLSKTASVADTNNNSVTGDPGDDITYTFTVTNSGSVTLNNLRLSDSQLAGLVCAPIASLAGGATATFSCTGNTHRVTPADLAAGTISNTATVTADGAAPVSASGIAPVLAVQPAPTLGLQLSKTATVADSNGNGVTGDPGDVISYAFSATNTGSVALTSVGLSDPGLPGLSCTPLASLAAGATASLSCSGNTRTILASDVAAGTLSNTARAQGTAPAALGSVNSNDARFDVSVQPAPQPALEVVKSFAVRDSNANTILGDAGDTIEYSFEVRNTGDTTLTNIDVSDPLLPALNCARLATLAPAASVTLVCSGNAYTITAVDAAAGKVTNHVTVQGSWAGGLAQATAADEVEARLTPQPGLQLSKAASVVDSNRDGTSGDAGDEIHYRFTLANSGATALEQFVLADTMLAGLDCDLPSSLAVGARVTLTCRNAAHIIDAADVARGYVENLATASGRWVGTTIDAQASDRVVTHLAPVAGLNLSKSWAVVDANGNGVSGDPGDRIDFTFTAHNTGTARLRNVMVNDAALAGLSCAPIAELPAGASAVFACSGAGHVISVADATIGTVRNDATASGAWSDTGAPVTARAQASVATLPAPLASFSLAVTPNLVDSNGNGVIGDAGDHVSFSYTLTNTSTVPLTHLVVRDPRLPDLSCQPVASLAPGASVTLTCTGNVYSLTPADVTAGRLDDTATASAQAPAGVANPPDATVSVTVPLPPARPPVTPIPTLSGWMMALLGLLLAVLGLRRRAETLK